MRFLTLLVLLALSLPAAAARLEYDLKAEQVARDTWFVEGKTEDFSFENGGDIVNTAFIVTTEGVIVLDTGVSRRYGEALRELIRQTTDQPIKLVINTHQHPDHFLGNQAFISTPIASLAKTQQQIRQQGDAFAENMYRLVGDWMRGTEVIVPDQIIEPGIMQLGDHQLEWIELTGHSGSDLVLYDRTTAVLFPFDMVFYQRALTTPHTPSLKQWQAELEQLRGIPFKVMLPGHGPRVSDHRALDQMQDYLQWLDEILRLSAERGMSMTEVMAQPIPERFNGIRLRRAEFERTVIHLYPGYEEAVFDL